MRVHPVRVISVRMLATLRTTVAPVISGVRSAMPFSEKIALVPAVLSVCVVSLLIAIFLFDHDFSQQEKHCNVQVCLDLISISQVAVGLVSIGNPISLGVIPISSFVAVGILPV